MRAIWKLGIQLGLRVYDIAKIEKQELLNAFIKREYATVTTNNYLTPDDNVNCSCNESHGEAERFGVIDLFPNGHRVMVIHPKIRWGRHSASASTTAELQLEEAVALVKTIPKFTIANAIIVGTDYNTKKKRIWRSGRIAALVKAKEDFRASAVMINVDMLSPLQQVELSKVFRVPIFDRYNIALLIFKMFAQTKDAWLQIELASIPYIRQRMKHVYAYHVEPKVLNIQMPSYSKSVKFEILRFREHELRKKIKASAEDKRNAISDMQNKKAAAKIAVVGYTNVGKSSLIERLTGKDVYVEDRLFVTLDASVYFYRFPSGSPAYFADTIGFISDLPINLVASFEATLSHVTSADLLLVVEDISHPNRLAQRETVLETLRTLRVKPEVIKNLVFVLNKADKVAVLQEEPGSILVSCLNGFGFPELIADIDKKVMILSGRVKRMVKVRPGSEVLNYLFAGSFLIGDPVPTSDGNYLLCTFVMSEADFSKFTSRFDIKKK